MNRTVLALSLLLAGCTPTAEDDEQPEPDVTNNAAATGTRLPTAADPMDRAALLTAVARAASSAALGRDDRQAQRALDGDPFEVRIRFGCLGGGGAPRVPGGPFNVSFDAETRTLRLRAAPDLTEEEGWIAQLGGEGIEAVEGFWMRRPWLLDPGCPPAPPQQPPGTEQEQAEEQEAQPAAEPSEPALARSGRRVGIAQFFTSADPRTRRREERAYEATKILPEGQEPSRQGYDLVLSGRLRDMPGGRVIACNVASADAPPECVVSAEFDRVRIERPDTRELIAEWRNS